MPMDNDPTSSLENAMDECCIKEASTSLQRSASTPNSRIPMFSGLPSRARKAKSSALIRFTANIQERQRKKKHYLVPIGSVKESGSPKHMTKWVDVVSIIEQGTTVHRNINQHEAKNNETVRTLSSGTLTSMLTKQKLYTVFPMKSRMVTLEDLISFSMENNCFEETHAKFIAVNIMMALRFLHDHNIFHGSICPKKIAFNERGYPCLTGFGAADIIDDRQSRPRERTQFEYTSPEQMYWEYITEATDMFSTGCLIYAVLYGKTPHQGEDNLTTRRNINNRDFSPTFFSGKLSSHGKKFIIKCIRKREDRRYSFDHMKDMFKDIAWFSGLSEEKLYKQTIPSPVSSVIRRMMESKTKN